MAENLTNQASAILARITDHRLKRITKEATPRTALIPPTKEGDKKAGIIFIHDGVKCARVMDDLLSIPAGSVDVHLLIFEAQWEAYKRLKKINGQPVPKWTVGKKIYCAEPPTDFRKAPNANTIKDTYAVLSFVETVRLARNLKLDWFFNIEWDCKFQGSGWLEALWMEHVRFCQGTCCSGTPTCWDPATFNPHSAAFYQKVIEYANKVYQDTGTPMIIKTHFGGVPRIYPNGALAWYRVEEILKAFGDGVKLIDNPKFHLEQFLVYANTICGYDYYFGHWLVHTYRDRVCEVIGTLSGSYSGWEEEMYSESMRLDMLNRGEKVAIHQYKH